MSTEVKSRRFKKRYVLLVLAVVLLGVSPVLLEKLREYEGELAGTILREVVEKESGGYYTVVFDEAYLALLTATIEIKDFQLIPNPQMPDEAKPINTFDITIPRLSLSLESLFNILFFKELTINTVRIEDPEISMSRTNEPQKRRPFSLEAGDLYSLVSQYLKLFKIEYFQIADGAFSYDAEGTAEDSAALAINRLNFEAKNFLLDSASEAVKKVFYTDQIELVIHDQSLFLSDGIHQFSFGAFHLSTADGLVRFDDIKVAPRANMDVSFYENPDLINIFDITIPSLHLSGVDFLTAYAYNRLYIDSIALVNPSILINDEMAPKKESENDFTAILTDYFDEVYIRSSNITRAMMDLHLIANDKGRGIKLENANIRLGDFRVDSTFFGDGMSKEYFTDIELSFDNYKANLPDSVHQVFIKHFKLSSFDNLIEIDSFRSSVRKDIEVKGIPDIYEIYLPAAGLTGFDWHAIANHQQADFGRFYMDQPEVQVHKYTKNRRGDGSQNMSASTLWSSIRPYAQLLSFDSIDINNGRFHWLEDTEELLGLDYVQVDIIDFHIDEDALERRDRFLFSDEIAIGFSDFDVETPDRTHIILLDTFSINSKTRSMQIDNFRFRPIHEGTIDRPVSYRGRIDLLEISGINFLNLLHEEHFLLDKIKLRAPELDLTHFSSRQKQLGTNSGLPDWIDFVNIGEFTVVDGQFRYAQDDLPILNLGRYSVSVQNFSLDSVLLARNQIEHRLEQFQFDGQSLSVHLPELDHTLKINHVGLDQAANSVSLSEISFKPNLESDSLDQFDFFSEALTLNGFDLEEALLDNRWRIEDAQLTKPVVRIRSESKNKSLSVPISMDSLYEQLTSQFKLMEIASFYFDSGTVDVTRGAQVVQIPRMDFSVEGFNIRQDIPRDTTQLFFAEDYSLTVLNPSFAFPQLQDSVSFKRITLQSSGRRFEVDSLYFALGPQRESQLEVLLPQITIDWFRLPKLIEEQKLHIQSVDLALPQITYAQAHTDNDGLPATLPLGQVGINEISIDTFKVTGTSLGYRNNAKEVNTGLDLNNLDIMIINLEADTTARVDGERLFWNKDIVLTGSDLEYFITDSLNKINAGSYRVSFGEQRITLTDAQLKPTLGREAYAEAFGKQTDWIDLDVDSLDVIGINWRALFFDNRVDIDQVRINGVGMSVFRDKRVPREGEQYKGLPHMNLQQLDIPIELDRFDLENGKITYTEHALASSTTGTIAFTDMSATFDNLVNTPMALSKNEILSANVSTKLMGQGELSLNATANLKDERGSFLVVGRLDKMDLTKLNRMMEHVAFVKVRSGQNNKMEFSIEANEDFALGEMTFYYEDLKISMISKKDESDKGMGPALGSFFANAFVINSNNPRWLFVRDGDIFYERNVNRSIFNYLSKSVLSGVVSSIGARSNKRDIKRKNKEVIRQLKEQRKEEKMLEERVGVYD